MLLPLIISIGYGGTVAAVLLHNVVWLRVVLLISTLAFLAFGLLAGIWAVVVWNVVLLMVNGWRLIEPLRGRGRAQLGAAGQAAHARYFPELTGPAFTVLWTTGRTERRPGDRLTIEGEEADAVLLIVDGSADATMGSHYYETVGPGDFVGETALGGDRTALTTVTANGSLTAQVWSVEQLASLAESHPEVATALGRAVGANVIARASRRVRYRQHCPVRSKPAPAQPVPPHPGPRYALAPVRAQGSRLVA